MPNQTGALTVDFLIDFLSRMPVVGEGETICEFGENPHSNFSPAYAMFEEDRDRWNVLGYVRVSEATARPTWKKAEAVFWSIGLSMPGGISHNASKGPCIFDAESKRLFCLWVDDFLQNAPDEWTPLEWVSFAKERGGAEFAKLAMVTSVQLRELWGEPLDEDWCCGSSDRQEEHETGKAEALEFDKSFVDVDWSSFGGMLYATPVKVVTASLGINPDHPCANIKWGMEFKKFATGGAALRLKQLEERYFVLMNNISTCGGGVLITKLRATGPQVIEIKGFAELAERMCWDLPDQFPRKTKAGTQIAVAIATECQVSIQETEDEIPGVDENMKGITRVVYCVAHQLENEDKVADGLSVMKALREMISSKTDKSGTLRRIGDDGQSIYWNLAAGGEKEYALTSCKATLKKRAINLKKLVH